MASRPSDYLNWTDGAISKITKPPSASALAGYTPGQAPPAQWVNYQFYTLDQWVQYLDQRSSGGGSGGSTVSNARLLNGGTWALAGTALSWSAAFQVALPGQADTANQVSAGGLTIPDGSVGYVNLNVPFQYSAASTSGSASLTNLSSISGLSAGMGVSGPGVPSGTTISSVSGTTVVMSANATATNGSALYTFQSTGTLTASVGSESTVSAGPQTCVFARNIGGVLLVGVGAVDMQMRDGEAKLLRGPGFSKVITAPAGVSMTQGTVVYVADSTDTTPTARTAGNCYPQDTTANGTGIRAPAAGVLAQNVSAGGTATIVTDGVVGGFSGLNPGCLVWGNVYQAGAVQQWTPPFIANTWKVLVGLAVSATQVLVRGGGMDQSMSPNPTFNNVTASGTMTAGAIASPLGFRMLTEPGGSGYQGWSTGGIYNCFDMRQNQWGYYAVQNSVIEGAQMSLFTNGSSGNYGQVRFNIYEQQPGTYIGAGTLGNQFKLLGYLTTQNIPSNAYTYKTFQSFILNASGAVANLPMKQGYTYWAQITSPISVPNGLQMQFGFSLQIVS